MSMPEAKIKMKEYKTEKGLMLAACDLQLYGKTFTDNDLVLEIDAFYDGASVSPTEFLERLECAAIANLVGELTVNLAVENGFVDVDCVIRIKNVPHAQIFVL